MYVDLGLAVHRHLPEAATDEEADARIRTADPFITSEITPSGEGWRRVAESAAEQGERSRDAGNFGLAPQPGSRALGHGLDPQRPA